MKYARFLLLLVLGLVFVLTVDARSQNSPYSDSQGNVGSWSWGKSQSRNGEESKEREPGETSWERLQAEQAPVESEPPRQEVLKSLSPLGWWRWWNGGKDRNSSDSTAEELNSDSTEEKTLNDAEEPMTEAE